MKGAQRKFDYDGIQRAYEGGMPAAEITKLYGIRSASLHNTAHRNGWHRPVRHIPLDEIRMAYERGDIIRHVAERFDVAEKSIRIWSKRHGWVRPVRDRQAEREAIIREYDAGATLKEISARHGYGLTRIKEIIAAVGELRSHDDARRKDPLGEALARAGYQRHVATPTRWSSSANLPAWGTR